MPPSFFYLSEDFPLISISGVLYSKADEKTENYIKDINKDRIYFRKIGAEKRFEDFFLMNDGEFFLNFEKQMSADLNAYNATRLIKFAVEEIAPQFLEDNNIEKWLEKEHKLQRIINYAANAKIKTKKTIIKDLRKLCPNSIINTLSFSDSYLLYQGKIFVLKETKKYADIKIGGNFYKKELFNHADDLKKYYNEFLNDLIEEEKVNLEASNIGEEENIKKLLGLRKTWKHKNFGVHIKQRDIFGDESYHVYPFLDTGKFLLKNMKAKKERYYYFHTKVGTEISMRGNDIYVSSNPVILTWQKQPHTAHFSFPIIPFPSIKYDEICMGTTSHNLYGLDPAAQAAKILSDAEYILTVDYREDTHAPNLAFFWWAWYPKFLAKSGKIPITNM